jgi:DNA-binding MarR family transcriptional regulator
MNTQAPKSPDKESQLTLELLQAIDNKDDISQRHLAQEMGVALGLANSYLKRCVKKGLIKIKTAPANRYLYYLTPNGFAEKARLTGEFLSTSLALFRQSGDVYAEIFAELERQGSGSVVFAGLSDLTEIAYLRALKSSINVVGVIQPATDQASFFELPVFNDPEQVSAFDAVILTSLEQTQELLEHLHRLVPPEQIIVPSLLLNMNYRSDPDPQTHSNL